MFFGCLEWSNSEDKLLYVAEKKYKKAVSYFAKPSEEEKKAKVDTMPVKMKKKKKKKNYLVMMTVIFLSHVFCLPHCLCLTVSFHEIFSLSVPVGSTGKHRILVTRIYAFCKWLVSETAAGVCVK